MSRLDELGEQLAYGALKAAGCLDRAGPPDLSEVAAAIGVRRTRFSRKDCAEGATRWTDAGPSIELEAGNGLERTKFTFAHELAHVIVRSEARSIYALRVLEHRRGRDLERLCNSMAGALIMPRAWLEGCLSDRLTLPDLFAVASAADVSPTAAAVRMRQIGYPNVLLLLRANGSGGWFITAAAGMPPGMRRQIVLHRSVREYLAAMECPSISSATLVVETDHGGFRSEVWLSKRRESAFAYVPNMRCSISSDGDRYFVRVDDRTVIVDIVPRRLRACKTMSMSLDGRKSE